MCFYQSVSGIFSSHIRWNEHCKGCINTLVCPMYMAITLIHDQVAGTCAKLLEYQAGFLIERVAAHDLRRVREMRKLARDPDCDLGRICYRRGSTCGRWGHRLYAHAYFRLRTYSRAGDRATWAIEFVRGRGSLDARGGHRLGCGACGQADGREAYQQCAAHRFVKTDGQSRNDQSSTRMR
jgi:hypothetical protein